MRTLLAIAFVTLVSLSSLISKDINIKSLSVNTNAVETAPYITIDGKYIIFTSNRNGSELDPNGKSSNDLWVLKLVNGEYTNPELINSSELFGKNFFNTKFLENSFTMTADGKTIYFASYGRTDTYGDCDIYFSRLNEDGWTMPAPLGRNVNSINWDGMPSISADGKTLYFVSNRKGSKSGSYDIWYSTYDSDMEEWQVAKNFTEINTKFNEFCPFIASDGLTLFFSTNGYEDSYGGSDLYYTKFDKTYNSWNKPVNLGQPINTKQDEGYISFDGTGTKMVFSRKDTLQPGNEDIYYAEVEPYFTPVQCFTLNAVSAENESPVYVNFLGKIGKRKLFSTNGNSTRVIISEKDFELAPFIDIEIQTKNPNFEKQSKTIRVLNPAMMDENQRKEYLNKMNYPVNFALFGPGKSSTPIKNLPLINADLTIKDAENESKPITEISVDQCMVEKRIPILNYIFFDENKSAIPDRYQLSSNINGKKFDEGDLLTMQDIDICHNVLNIIGKRMADNQALNITLTGCNSNKGKELKNLKLSKDRAQSVASFLTKEWGIAANRMTVTGRGLPELANNAKTKEAGEENQRVEITSDNPELLKDIIIQESMLKSNPKRINVAFKTDYLNSSGDWEFTIETHDSILKTLKGQNSTSNNFEWNAAYDLEHLKIADTKQIQKNNVKEDVKKTDDNQKSAEKSKPTFLENAKSALKKVGTEIGKAASDFEKSLNSETEEEVRKAKAKEEAKKHIVFELIANDNSSAKKVVSVVDLPFKINGNDGKTEVKKIYNYRILVLDKTKGLTAEQNKALDNLSSVNSQESAKYINDIKAYFSQSEVAGNSENANFKQIQNENGLLSNTPEGRIFNTKSVLIELEKK